MKQKTPFNLSFDQEAFQQMLENVVETAIKKALPIKETQNHKQEKEVHLLTKNDVAKIFSVSIKTINDWVKQGILSPTKVSSRVYFKREEISRLINDNTFRNGKR